MISYPKSDFKASEQTCAHSSHQMCQFLAIYPHFRLLISDPLTPPPLLLTKMLSLDAVAIVYEERRLFQAVSNPIAHQLPPFA